MSSLLFREITPEDYDLLLQLDEALPKSTLKPEVVKQLPSAACESFAGGSCTICLSEFEPQDDVAELPCRHFFHRPCIMTWLSQYKSTCPVCLAPA
jgi:hypothetical protein